MFAGTSTGSIIACAIAKGMSATAIRQFYEQKGELIFPNMDYRYWLNNLADKIRTGDPSLPLFKGSGLESVLQDPSIFPGNLLFGTLPPTLAVAYDTYNRAAVVFKSHKTDFAQIPVWEVCRCSSAAPVAFPSYFVTDATYLESLRNAPPRTAVKNPVPVEVPKNKQGVEGVPLIDGGVVAGNPTLCAIAERINMNKGLTSEQKIGLDNIIVASFGTGQSIRRIKPEEAETWGGLDWVDFHEGIPLLDVFSDGSSDATDYITTQMIGESYYRYQPLIPKEVSTFQANPDNLKLMTNVANDFLDKEDGDAYLDKLVKAIS